MGGDLYSSKNRDGIKLAAITAKLEYRVSEIHGMSLA
jgi:hypothetical protein